MIFLIPIALYFVPTIVASYKGAPQFASIFVVNFFLGWTIVGWVVALAWALKTEPKPVQVIMNQTPTSTATLCSNCGKYSPAEARFCTYCGTGIAA